MESPKYVRFLVFNFFDHFASEALCKSVNNFNLLNSYYGLFQEVEKNPFEKSRFFILGWKNEFGGKIAHIKSKAVSKLFVP